jgi:hypothetical protein
MDQPDQPDQRARVLITAANEAGLTCRALGGAAVRLLCPHATAAGPLHRELNDLDLATTREDADKLARLLEDQDLLPERRFNLLHGDKRLLFQDPANGKHVDVFVDSFEMCHKLVLRGRLHLAEWSLAAPDLLLTKLQIAQINEKDIKDFCALVLEPDEPMTATWFDPGYLAGVLGGDWGWWKTVSDNLAVAAAALPALELAIESQRTVAAVTAQLSALAADCDKSRRWRWRSRLGTKVPWREEPEEAQR